MQKGHVLFFAAIFLAVGVLAYDSQVAHPGLTEAAIRVFDSQATRRLTSEQANWIIKGSVAEDAIPRFLNHFYDPTSGQGLSGNNNAKDWALNGGWSGSTGDFSELAIMRNYRDGNVQRAYEGIGHISHLLQDMTVPAHVRNDAHPEGDFYEMWVRDNFYVINGQIINFDNLGSAFDSLALFTHDNFYSLKTITGNIKYDLIKEELSSSGASLFYETRNGFKLARIKKNKDGLIYDFDQSINPDYYAQLAPKAVGYSAGAIAYFQKKFDEIDQEEKIKDDLAVTFLGIGQEMLSEIWHNANYALNDIVGSANVQVRIDKTVDIYNSSKVAIDNIGLTIDSVITDSAAKIARPVSTTSVIIKQTPIKIVDSQLKKALPSPDNHIAKDNIDFPDLKDVIADLVIKPAQATANDDDTDAQPVRPKYPFFHGGSSPVVVIEVGNDAPPADQDDLPDNTVPIEIVPPIATSTEPQIIEPAVPSIFFVEKPESISAASVARFVFGSDQASSTFVYRVNFYEWIPCSSTVEFDVANGINDIEVNAINDGVYSDDPIEYEWTVAPLHHAQFQNDYNFKYADDPAIEFWWDNLSDNASTTFDAEYVLNDGERQTLAQATTSDHVSLGLTLQFGDVVKYYVRACNEFGLCEDWQHRERDIIHYLPDHLVISGVQISGGSSTDEWVELYNPTDDPISLTGYKLVRVTSGGIENNLVASLSGYHIGKHGHKLIANPYGYDGEVAADLVYSNTSQDIARNNSIILYKNGTVIDKVGFGASAAAFELLPVDQFPPDHHALVRKSGSLGFEYGQGHARDTDDNASDFLIIPDYAPQNDLNYLEPWYDWLNVYSY